MLSSRHLADIQEHGGAVGTSTKEMASRAKGDALGLLLHERWRLPVKKMYRPLVEGMRGIEVGGPSTVFRTALPLYRFVGQLDGVNFATDTIWEGHLDSATPFAYSASGTGRQYIADATDLHEVPTATYDFLLSSNCLEHVANPIKALVEWRRVLRPRGTLVLVLPNQKSNFDHRRPVTAMDHLLDDFAKNTAEDDLTHLDEILALHDLSMDPPAGNLAQFRERSLQNFENRTLHHHVFDMPLIAQMLDYLEFEMLDATTTRTDFFALARSGR
jgi:SAM-dependent methyltransferase